MTREEAVDNLKCLLECNYVDSFEDAENEALDMAIQALEQKPCEDAVSKQEVLDQTYLWSKDEFLRVTNPFDYLRKRINSISPVTPEPKTGHWIKTPKAVMGEGYMWYCDKCEYQVYQDSSRPYPSERYCPNCGCRMVEPKESEE